MNFFRWFYPGFYISSQTTIDGNVSVNENCRIAGVVNGNIDGKAHISVERNGVLNGNLYAGNASINGKVKGNVHCNGKVSVLKGEVHGDIFASEVIIGKEGVLKGSMAQLHNDPVDEPTFTEMEAKAEINQEEEADQKEETNQKEDTDQKEVDQKEEELQEESEIEKKTGFIPIPEPMLPGKTEQPVRKEPAKEVPQNWF